MGGSSAVLHGPEQFDSAFQNINFLLKNGILCILIDLCHNRPFGNLCTGIDTVNDGVGSAERKNRFIPKRHALPCNGIGDCDTHGTFGGNGIARNEIDLIGQINNSDRHKKEDCNSFYDLFHKQRSFLLHNALRTISSLCLVVVSSIQIQ